MADGAAGFRQDSSGPALLRIPPRNLTFSHTGLSPPSVDLSRSVPLTSRRHLRVLQPRECRNILGLGSAAFAHHYSRYHCCFLFLPLLRCFSSGGSPPHSRMTGLQPAGLPHSDIQGSTLICSYPWLFAACHVPPLDTSRIRTTSLLSSVLCLLYARVKKITLCFDFFLFFSCLLPACQRTLAAPCATRVENKGLEPLTPSLQS